MTRVAIVGSRDYAHPEHVRAFVASLPDDAIVVSGGARGPDRIAADVARARGLAVVEHLPDWERFPRRIDGWRAYHERNRLIVQDADEVRAFWDLNSDGTRSTLRYARGMKRPAWVCADMAEMRWVDLEHLSVRFRL